MPKCPPITSAFALDEPERTLPSPGVGQACRMFAGIRLGAAVTVPAPGREGGHAQLGPAGDDEADAIFQRQRDEPVAHRRRLLHVRCGRQSAVRIACQRCVDVRPGGQLLSQTSASSAAIDPPWAMLGVAACQASPVKTTRPRKGMSTHTWSVGLNWIDSSLVTWPRTA
jgi:hypothetical protein